MYRFFAAVGVAAFAVAGLSASSSAAQPPGQLLPSVLTRSARSPSHRRRHAATWRCSKSKGHRYHAASGTCVARLRPRRFQRAHTRSMRRSLSPFSARDPGLPVSQPPAVHRVY